MASGFENTAGRTGGSVMDKLEESIQGLKYDDAGLIPAVCVDAETQQVLMVAYMNETSLLETVRTGRTHFWSRSRQKYWMKGESSGHTQDVRAVYADCDMDTVVLEVVQHGAACHEGYYSCFYRRLNDAGEWEVVAEKVFDPDTVYKDKS
jgi:phosphoribosyl-AMP cyclohydrolase